MMAADGGVGLVVGGLDSFIQDKTNDQIMTFKANPANAGKELSMLSQYSTYYNYGLPIVSILALALAGNYFPDAWPTRMMVASGQLVGHKGGQQLIDYSKTTKAGYSGPRQWHEYGGAAAAQQAAAAAAMRVSAHYDAYVPQPNPQPIQTGPQVPTVQPQGLTGIRGET
jgi:hypothetical protein